MAIGIDVGDGDYADAIDDRCRRDGLLVSTEGSTVLLPSLANRQADRREKAGHSGALAIMRHGGLAANPWVALESPRIAALEGGVEPGLVWGVTWYDRWENVMR